MRPSCVPLCYPLSALLNTGDLNDGQWLTVTLTALVTGFVLVLQDPDLWTLGLFYDFSVDGNTAELISLGFDGCAIGEQNRGKSHGIAWLALKLLNLDEVTFSNLVLLSAGLDDRVHGGLPLIYTRLGAIHPAHTVWKPQDGL